ncbi:MAG: hypothetical protein JNK26_04710 [Candidatus Doudnabacteria bacterium]|nr:hypothetical protein [Candidatus Doudnabacteria bacterium]
MIKDAPLSKANQLSSRTGEQIPVEKIIEGTWERNLDPENPNFEAQKRYALLVLEYQLTVLLLKYYAKADALRDLERRVLGEGVSNLELSKEPAQLAMTRYVLMQDKGTIEDYSNSRIQQVFGDFDLSITDPLPLPNENDNISAASIFIREAEWKAHYSIKYALVVVGRPCTGKTTLAGRVASSGRVFVTVTADQSPKNVTGIRNNITFTQTGERREIYFPQATDLGKVRTDNLKYLEPRISETTELTTFEKLIVYILLTVGRTFNFGIKNLSEDFIPSQMMTVGDIFNNVSLICASAGFDHIPESILKLLELYPFQPHQILELQPPEELRAEWLEVDKKNYAKRAQALAVEGNLKGCFQSLRTHFASIYTIANPAAKNTIEQVKSLAERQGNYKQEDHKIGFLVGRLNHIKFMLLNLHIDPPSANNAKFLHSIRELQKNDPEGFEHLFFLALQLLAQIGDMTSSFEDIKFVGFLHNEEDTAEVLKAMLQIVTFELNTSINAQSDFSAWKLNDFYRAILLSQAATHQDREEISARNGLVHTIYSLIFPRNPSNGEAFNIRKLQNINLVPQKPSSVFDFILQVAAKDRQLSQFHPRFPVYPHTRKPSLDFTEYDSWFPIR